MAGVAQGPSAYAPADSSFCPMTLLSCPCNQQLLVSGNEGVVVGGFGWRVGGFGRWADACGLLIRFKAFQGRWLAVFVDTHSIVNDIVK